MSNPTTGVEQSEYAIHIDARTIYMLRFGRFRSESALARELGLHQSEFGRMIRGERPWRLHDVIALAKALDTSVAYLIGETDDPERPVRLQKLENAPTVRAVEAFDADGYEEVEDQTSGL